MNLSPDLPVAVVLGLSPTGLYAVRELGEAGVPVTGVASYRQAGQYSRYLTRTIVEDDEGRRMERLCEMADAGERKPVLIPTSDQDVDFIMRNAEALAQRFAFQASYRDGTGAAILAKASFYGICRSNGIDIPGSWQADRDGVPGLAGEIVFPCLLKPSRIHAVKQAMGGDKGWVARDRDEFHKISASLPNGDTDWLIQEVVPGPESEITLYAAYFDNRSRPHQAFTARKLRQYPPGFGSASLVASHREPETGEITERLLAARGYRGIAASEFKRDPRDGKLKMIEINPRPSLWFAVSTAAGKRITLAAYHHLAETGMAVEDTDQKPNVGWRYGVKDAYSAVYYRLKRDFVLPAPDVNAVGRLAPVVGAVWRWSDPAPAFGDAWTLFAKALGRLMPMKTTPKPTE